MNRALLAAGALLVATACGESAGPAADEAPNLPPVIDSVTLHPAEARTSDGLSVAVRVQDPERDPVTLTYAWFGGGRPLKSGDSARLDPFSARKGERVRVRVTASDGRNQTVAESDAVEIRNAPPIVSGAALSPETALTSDEVRVEVTARDVDDDELTYRYRWLINGVTQDVDTAVFPPGRAVRGDRLSVQVAATDGSEVGPWVESDPIQIGNSAPSITTQPTYTLVGERTYQYEVKATDPDGDKPLRYELIKGPEGMRVDRASGVVSWEIPDGSGGTFPIELAVSDPHGARTLQRYSLDLRWGEDAPADTP